MLKLIKTGLFALSLSVIIDVLILQFPENIQVKFSEISIPIHVLIMIIFIGGSIIRSNNISRINNFKNGIIISLVFSLGISAYYFSYYKWVNPTYLIEKKEALIALTKDDELLELAKEKIKNEPEYYKGKSPQDLIEMQQDNIKEMFKPGKIIPLYLMIFTLSGMVFSLIISLLNFIYYKKISS